MDSGLKGGCGWPGRRAGGAGDVWQGEGMKGVSCKRDQIRCKERHGRRVKGAGGMVDMNCGKGWQGLCDRVTKAYMGSRGKVGGELTLTERVAG